MSRLAFYVGDDRAVKELTLRVLSTFGYRWASCDDLSDRGLIEQDTNWIFLHGENVYHFRYEEAQHYTPPAGEYAEVINMEDYIANTLDELATEEMEMLI